MSENKTMEVEITTMPTPNPNALKFISNYTMKAEGNSTYKTPLECGENDMALKLFMLRGVDQLHFYDNALTVTKFEYEPWDELEPKIVECLKIHIPFHNPNYFDPDPEAERRRNLTPEQEEIEKILDRTIRPGLQADGGDIQTIDYKDNVLIVKYQGACGTCPSATTGTLEAIKAILKDEFNPDIDVYIAPEY